MAKEENKVFVCSACKNPLFEADKKFEAGCGFPSFYAQIGNQIQHRLLTTYGRERTQLLCNGCGAHLGHLFPNKKTPTRLRYCINATSICLQETY